MNLNEQFDKLEARAFPFDEAAWQRAQQGIASQRSQRRGAWYLLGLVPLAFIAWLLWPSAPQQQELAHSIGAGATPTSVEREAASTAASEEDAAVATEIAAAGKAPAMPDEARPNAMRAIPAEPASRPEPATSVNRSSFSVTSPSSLPLQPATVPTSPASGASQGDAEPSSATQDPGRDIAGDDPPTLKPKEPGESRAAQDAADPAFANSARLEAPWDERDEPTSAQAVTDVSVAANDTAVDQALDGQNAAPSTETRHAAADPAEPAAQASDSIAVEPEVPAALQPLITPRSLWEITVFAGAQRTLSRYTSGRHDQLTGDPQQTWAFGAECMRMGRNLGIGFGLHHATYADRFATPAQRTQAWEVTRNWFLQSIDTTILIITGTDTIGGQVVHTGFNASTTVQVLASRYDSTSVVSIRAARSHAVRTSYLELPLLLDGHLVQGRWSFGIRGGPSISLLTARSGSLPSENDELDQPVRDAVVRQWSLGWSARAYARYRFNSAWSVGIEPMARGQLMDAINGPVIARRSEAYGALLSLSYKLR